MKGTGEVGRKGVSVRCREGEGGWEGGGREKRVKGEGKGRGRGQSVGGKRRRGNGRGGRGRLLLNLYPLIPLPSCLHHRSLVLAGASIMA